MGRARGQQPATSNGRFDAVLGTSRGRINYAAVFSTNAIDRRHALQQIHERLQDESIDEAIALLAGRHGNVNDLDPDVRGALAAIETEVAQRLWAGATEASQDYELALAEEFADLPFTSPNSDPPLSVAGQLQRLIDSDGPLPTRQRIAADAQELTAQQYRKALATTLVNSAVSARNSLERLLPPDSRTDSKHLFDSSGLTVTDISDLLTPADWGEVFTSAHEHARRDMRRPEGTRQFASAWASSLPSHLDRHLATKVLSRLPQETQQLVTAAMEQEHLKRAERARARREMPREFLQHSNEKNYNTPSRTRERKNSLYENELMDLEYENRLFLNHEDPYEESSTARTIGKHALTEYLQTLTSDEEDTDPALYYQDEARTLYSSRKENLPYNKDDLMGTVEQSFNRPQVSPKRRPGRNRP